MEFKDLPLLEHLNETQRQNLEAACEYQDFKDGERLIEQGQVGTKLFFILEGAAQVRVQANGREQVVATVEAPAIVGEMELLTGAKRSASVYATGPVHCALLEISALRARLEDGDPAALKFIYRVAEVLATRVAAVSHKMSELASRLEPKHAEDLKTFQAKVFSEWNF